MNFSLGNSFNEVSHSPFLPLLPRPFSPPPSLPFLPSSSSLLPSLPFLPSSSSLPPFFFPPLLAPFSFPLLSSQFPRCSRVSIISTPFPHVLPFSLLLPALPCKKNF